MKKLVYPIALVCVSLVSVACFTTATAITLASYSKVEKASSEIVKEPVTENFETARR